MRIPGSLRPGLVTLAVRPLGGEVGPRSAHALARLAWLHEDELDHASQPP
jgi:hypothetical protein